MPTTPKKKTTTMSDSHKAALATGREEGRVVRAYLEALESRKVRRGRKVSPESIKKRIEAIDRDLGTAEPIKRVQLVQERMDLTDKLGAANPADDLASLEAAFVKAAKGYSTRKGISYAARREVGVPAAVLAKAGISR